MTSSPASSTPDVLPLKFPSGLRLTPEQFELFAPRTVRRSGSETSGRNSELLFQLQQYAKASGRWKVFESSGGFRLPDSSVVSPMPRWFAWIAGGPSAPRNVDASRPSAQTWW